MIIKAEVILNKSKSLEKPYFDKMYNKFSREVQKSFILEEVRFKKFYVKPSKRKKLKKEFFKLKWQHLQ